LFSIVVPRGKPVLALTCTPMTSSLSGSFFPQHPDGHHRQASFFLFPRAFSPSSFRFCCFLTCLIPPSLCGMAFRERFFDRATLPASFLFSFSRARHCCPRFRALSCVKFGFFGFGSFSHPSNKFNSPRLRRPGSAPFFFLLTRAGCLIVCPPSFLRTNFAFNSQFRSSINPFHPPVKHCRRQVFWHGIRCFFWGFVVFVLLVFFFFSFFRHFSYPPSPRQSYGGGSQVSFLSLPRRSNCGRLLVSPAASKVPCLGDGLSDSLLVEGVATPDFPWPFCLLLNPFGL